MKKILSVLLLISTIILCFAGCASANEQDEALAVECAKEEAEEYYYENFHGKSVASGEYTGCEVSVSGTEFKRGKYIVNVELKIKAIEGTYGFPLHVTQNIEYTIKVKNGSAEIVDTEYSETK